MTGTSSGSSGAARWHLSSEFDAREWDGEAVVRVASTAATHALSPLASAIIAQLREAGLDLDGLVAAVFADDGDESASDAAPRGDRSAVQAALVELESLRLVSRADPA